MTSFFPESTSASQMLDMLQEATQAVAGKIIPGTPVRVTLKSGLTVQLGIKRGGVIGQFFPVSPQAGIFTLADLKTVI